MKKQEPAMEQRVVIKLGYDSYELQKEILDLMQHKYKITCTEMIAELEMLKFDLLSQIIGPKE